MRAFFDGGVAFTGAMGLVGAGWTAWRVRRPHRWRPARVPEGVQMVGAVALASGMAMAIAPAWTSIALAAAWGVLLSVIVRLLWPMLSWPGATRLAMLPLGLMVVLPWSWFALRESALPLWTHTAWNVLLVLALPLLAWRFALVLAQQALYTHAHWQRPTRPLPGLTPGRPVPKVSLHLPCYAEPPEVVMATLDALARLDYPDYEVIVCDNNTESIALWKPLAQHCRRLNAQLGVARFQFFHVAPLAGAKAGALNHCLLHTAEDASLVAVIDADYVSRRDFLSRLVGFFDDPRIAYVQTSHDYRDFRHSTYQRHCYWEYLPYYKVDMPGIQEWGAPFTIGTMCLLRKQALIEAGGWAEWCLTEDSEVSIRLRACGHQGVYLRSTAGRGLIPERFEDYKKQRFRWSVGPAQQLARHWRLMWPRALGGQGQLGGWSRLLEAQRSLECALMGPLALLGLLSSALLLWAVATERFPRLALPLVVYALILCGALTRVLRTVHMYRLAGTRRIDDMVGGEVARLSLVGVKLAASFAALSGRPQAWRRTPKFRMASRGWRAVGAAWAESLLALGFGALALWLWQQEPAFGLDLAALSGAGAAVASLTFLAAPLMAWRSEQALAPSSTETDHATHASHAMHAPEPITAFTP